MPKLRSSNYRTAEQSRKPGYLAKRFEQIRREQRNHAELKAHVEAVIKADAEAQADAKAAELDRIISKVRLVSSR